MTPKNTVQNTVNASMPALPGRPPLFHPKPKSNQKLQDIAQLWKVLCIRRNIF